MSHLDKIFSLTEAVKRFIPHNAHISFGGFTVNRQPMACAHEIIRQKITGLHIYMHSGGQAFDLLVGAGCVKTAEIAYGANGRFAPTCIRFRKAVENGGLVVEDYTNYQMTLRFQAGAMGVPFLPVRSGMGTDVVKKWGFNVSMRQTNPRLPNQKLTVMEDPFTEKDHEKVVLVPAINPDVTVIHVQQADRQGTVRIQGLTFADVEQARAAKHVIATCEKLVDPEELRTEPERNQLPFFMVDAIVHVPLGAHPTACYGFYDYDAQHLIHYKLSARDNHQFATYLQEFVYSVKDHHKYLEKIGEKALKDIQVKPPYGYSPGLKRG
jgi:glutaconate CoA-transferase subunit A